VTGWDLTPDEYLKTGERILSLRKAFNAREGIKPGDHTLSERALGKTPLTKGPLKGVRVDMEWLMKAFYDTVGWDPNTDGPTAEKMKELGIAGLCE
jgi:aldehyde:ferredoxin oxidoreductase